ncbi:site-2 protease family protein [Actinotalea sp. JY-7876]|uniref:site-2 protease family protein n=1 Tax=Actinotalea sp. JY-7876 TaxID=2758442 RepID=UPI0015F35B95|nr:site-2 protease family protein [Actinotalea sp. JY-7876]
MDGTRTAARPRTWVAGRIAGAPLEVSPGSLVTLAVLVLALWRVLDAGAGPGGPVLLAALLAAALVGASVVAHELAHAVVARRYGLAVERVVVTAWGARVSFDAQRLDARTTAVVAAAGPLTSLLLALPGLLALTGAVDGLAGAALLAVAAVNAATGALNLLPALPFDGGKILAAGLWAATGDRERGTVVAAHAGRVLAVLVVVAVALRGLASGAAPEPFTVVLTVLAAAFLWAGAGAALRSARSAAAVARLDLRRLLVPAVALPAQDTVADAAALATGGSGVVVLDAHGRVAGWADPAALAAVPAAAWSTTSLAAVLRPLGPAAVVRADVGGADAVRAVAAGASVSPVLVVVDAAGEVLGLLRAQDVVAALRPGPRQGRAGRPDAAA